MSLLDNIIKALSGKNSTESFQRKIAFQKISDYLVSNKLSTIPAVLHKIMALANNMKAGAEDYARLCEQDPSSSIRILRLANSAYYGPQPDFAVRTIKDAIVRIGFAKAREVINSVVVSNIFKTYGTIADYSPARLWMNSIAVAIGNRAIFAHDKSKVSPHIDPYLAGLLHNIGIPLLHLCFAQNGFKEAIQKRYDTDGYLVNTEAEFLEITHPEAGLLVATKWNLSPEIAGVIAHHHDLGMEEDAVAFLVHLTRYSQFLAFNAQLGYSDFSAKDVGKYEESRGYLMLENFDEKRIVSSMQREIGAMIQSGWFTSFELDAKRL
jgi:HD-like signal output (HDOD) protein